MTRTPPGLSAEARQFYRQVAEDYGIDDEASCRLLRTAAEALDLMRTAQAELKRDGLTVPDRYGGRRAHPAAAILRDARNGMLAAIKALGLDLAPDHGQQGRPPDPYR